MTRVLLVDTNFSARPILAALQEEGFEVYTIGGRPDDALASAYPNYLHLDYSDIDALETLIRDREIELLVPGCNDRSYAVCCEVSLRCGISGFEKPGVVRELHDKSSFRELCRRLSLPAPRAYGSAQEALSAKGPLIVKPVDSFSGRGVTVVRDRAETSVVNAMAKAQQSSLDGCSVIEDFVEGQLFSYSAFFSDRQVLAAFSVAEYCSVNPYTVDTSYVVCENVFEKQLEQDVLKLIDHLQLTSGLLHIQYISNGEQYWLIEPTRRCPGDLYSELIERATGYNYAKAYMSSFVGKRPEVRQANNITNTVRHTVSTRTNGKLESVDIIEDRCLEAWYPLAESGEYMKSITGNRLGLAFFETGSEDERDTLVSTIIQGDIAKISMTEVVDE